MNGTRVELEPPAGRLQGLIGGGDHALSDASASKTAQGLSRAELPAHHERGNDRHPEVARKSARLLAIDGGNDPALMNSTSDLTGGFTFSPARKEACLEKWAHGTLGHVVVSVEKPGRVAAGRS